MSVLEVPQASKLGVKLEAKLIIPMHYDAAALKAFLKDQEERQRDRAAQQRASRRR